MERLAFRSSFIFLIFGVAFQIFLSLIFIKVIFGWVASIKGWTYYEVLLLVGTSIFLEGVLWMSCAYLHILKILLKNGALDGILVKPMDSQFLVSCYRGDLEDLVRVILGASIIIFAISHIEVSGWQLVLNGAIYLVLVANAYAIMYSISVIINSIAFWTIESPTTFAMFEVIGRISQYPADIFSGSGAKLIFSTLMPVMFISTVPAKILSRGFQGSLILESFAITFIFINVSRYVWKKGLGAYSSASS
jgi:ABC-2 type transport system permease protein